MESDVALVTGIGDGARASDPDTNSGCSNPQKSKLIIDDSIWGLFNKRVIRGNDNV